LWLIQDKAVWNEQWMGWLVAVHYEEQSNYTIVEQLDRKLLLAHGELDENVPVSTTLKLVNALVEVDKDFELLVLPGRDHSFGNEPYFA
jgi:dipeptidyl-peptidase 4